MSALKSHISALIEAAEPGQVWVPTDFAQLGSRDAIDKTLQRMVQAGAQPISVIGLAGELQRDWGREGAERLRTVLRHYFAGLRQIRSPH